MTDEEVKHWLSDDERVRFDLLDEGGDFVEQQYAGYIREHLRTLAETRKALWSVRLYDSCWCTLCGAKVDYAAGEDADGMMVVPYHRDACILATMPRTP